MDAVKEDIQRGGVTGAEWYGQAEMEAGDPLWRPLKGAAKRDQQQNAKL